MYMGNFELRLPVSNMFSILIFFAWAFTTSATLITQWTGIIIMTITEWACALRHRSGICVLTMLTVKRKTGHISVLERCSSLTVALMLMIASPCCSCAALNVTGIPEWLKPAVKRSLNAVWSEIPDSPEIDREATLGIVALRLFAGYDIDVKVTGDEPAVVFQPSVSSDIKPSVIITAPELRGMASKWFEHDTSGMTIEICGLVESIPQVALTWADEALRDHVRSIIERRLPGWEFSQQIYISRTTTIINLSFRPGTPLILSFQPALYSRTVPAVFTSDLEARLIPELSPLIGLPVKWAELHRVEIEQFAYDYLRERHAVANLRANVDIKFTAGTVSQLEARVDSEDFMFSLWVSACAGIEGKYPEAGTLFAFRPAIKFNPELYAELILSLDEFDELHRLGWRFEPVNNFWAGVEMQWPENEYFLRFHYNPVRFHRFYAWYRWSPELEVHECSLGYNIDDHISVEIYYYNACGDDKIGLRGMWHL